MTKSTTIYGIKNCDTMKKARAWLDSHGVSYEFHDYKTAGAPKEKLKAWCDELGWETLLNRAGTTFRKLPDKDKEALTEMSQKRAFLRSLTKPPEIDYLNLHGATKGKRQEGIYHLEGDVLTVCMGAPGAARPGELTSVAGDGRTLTSWQR